MMAWSSCSVREIPERSSMWVWPHASILSMISVDMFAGFASAVGVASCTAGFVGFSTFGIAWSGTSAVIGVFCVRLVTVSTLWIPVMIVIS